MEFDHNYETRITIVKSPINAIVQGISLISKNKPGLWISSTGEYRYSPKPVYELHAEVNGEAIRFQFERDKPIVFEEYDMPKAIEEFLIPYLILDRSIKTHV